MLTNRHTQCTSSAIVIKMHTSEVQSQICTLYCCCCCYGTLLTVLKLINAYWKRNFLIYIFLHKTAYYLDKKSIQCNCLYSETHACAHANTSSDVTIDSDENCVGGRGTFAIVLVTIMTSRNTHNLAKADRMWHEMKANQYLFTYI